MYESMRPASPVGSPHWTVATPFPAVAAAPTGAEASPGITVTGDECGPVTAPACACTVTRYRCPSRSPLTRHPGSPPGPVVVQRPGPTATTYPVTVTPPVGVDATQDTQAEPSSGVAVTWVGALGFATRWAAPAIGAVTTTASSEPVTSVTAAAKVRIRRPIIIPSLPASGSPVLSGCDPTVT